MKTSKVLGAVALTAALAMGTMPAFAAGVDSTNLNNFSVTAQKDGSGEVTGYTGNGSTEVWATTYVVQLNVTVPIRMDVAVPATSGTNGSDITFPSSNAYKITNNSTAAIQIASVKADDAGGHGFTLVEQGNAPSAPGVTPAVAASGIFAQPTAGAGIRNYSLNVARHTEEDNLGVIVPHDGTPQNIRPPYDSNSDGTNDKVGVEFTGSLVSEWTVNQNEVCMINWTGKVNYSDGALGTTQFNNTPFQISQVVWTVTAAA